MAKDWAELILKTIFSWPAVAMLVLIILRGAIRKFAEEITDAEFGPIKVSKKIAELEAATEALKKVNKMMVEHDLLKDRVSKLGKSEQDMKERETILSQIGNQASSLIKLVGL